MECQYELIPSSCPQNKAGTCTTECGTAAGHAVAARGGFRDADPVNREPTVRPQVASGIPLLRAAEDINGLSMPCGRRACRSRRAGSRRRRRSVRRRRRRGWPHSRRRRSRAARSGSPAVRRSSSCGARRTARASRSGKGAGRRRAACISCCPAWDGAGVLVAGWGGRHQAASWKTSPRVNRWPERITDTPCRTGAADQPRADCTGRSRVVKTSPWPCGIRVAVARDWARGRCS